MKAFIINRNLLTWPKAMADILAGQGHEPVFIDNASTYQPLMDYYGSCDYRVIHLGHNAGHTAPWMVIGRQEEPYVVTDPDLDISAVPSDWPEVLLEGLEHTQIKCGLGLMKDLPKASIYYHQDVDHGDRVAETINLERHSFCSYPIDTTFAVYHPLIDSYRIGGIRSTSPYMARHLPWYIVPEIDDQDPAVQTRMDDEYWQYLKSAGPSSSMAAYPYVKRMAEDYERARDGKQNQT